MKAPIQSASDFAVLVRAARKAQSLRQDDAAGASGVSASFMLKLESGNTNLNWGHLFEVLQSLGIRLSADLPDVASNWVVAEREKLMRRQAQGHRKNGKLTPLETNGRD